MFTLTKASLETKLILKWLAISFVSLILLIILFRFAVYVKNIFFPAPPPKPTLAYGKLPVILFPGNASDTKFTYSINTVSGNLPQLNNLAKVYQMVYNPPDLLALQNAQKMVSAIDFNSKPYEVSPQLYEWTMSNPAQLHLRMDILNYNFSITASPLSDPYAVSATNLPTQQGAIDFVKGRLQSMGLYYDDLDETKTTAQILKVQNNAFVAASSYSDTQFIKVNLFQKDIDSLPIYYEKPDTSTMNFLVGGGQNNAQILGAEFVHQSPSSNYATYPIKTTQMAFDQLASGSAYIASYYGTSSNISIKNVFLAYYIGSVNQDFLMPIIVFQGDNGFYAYVSAVTDEWINK